MLKYEMINVNHEIMARIVSFKNDTSLRMFPMHWHQSTELLYCRKGKLEVRIHSEHYVLSEGDLIYINSNVPHETRSREPNEVYMIQFKNLFYDAQHKIVDLNTLQKEIDPSVKDALTKLMRSAGKISTDKKEFYTLELNSVLYQIKYLLVKSFLREVQETHEETQELMLVIKESLMYINDNYSFGIDVEDVAKFSGYSNSYFSRKFKDLMGISCLVYLENRRFQHALSLMSSSKMISEIAIESGFPNVKSLRKSLYKDTGMTPTQYRKSLKDGY